MTHSTRNSVLGFVIGVVISTAGWMFFGVTSFEKETTELPLGIVDQPVVIGSAQVDLNADRIADFITYSKPAPISSSSLMILSINGTSVNVPGYNPVGFFGIVDLFTPDNTYEIAVSDMGPSGDPTTVFYAYDGTTIKTLGTVEGLYQQMVIDGKGTLITTVRAHILDTWFYRDTYKLDQDKFVHVPKDFYERIEPTYPVTMLKDLTLTSGTSAPFILKKGEVVSLIGCDDIHLCGVETEKGTIGFFFVEEFNQIRGTGESADAYFDGLSNAD